MVALCNRADHYIFILFLSFFFFFFFFLFFARLISAVGDWMSTIFRHMVWFNGFGVLAALLHGILVVGVSQTLGR